MAFSLFLSPPSPGESKEISSLCGPFLNRFDTQSEEVRGGCRDAHPREVTQRATQRASDEKCKPLDCGTPKIYLFNIG